MAVQHTPYTKALKQVTLWSYFPVLSVSAHTITAAHHLAAPLCVTLGLPINLSNTIPRLKQCRMPRRYLVVTKIHCQCLAVLLLRVAPYSPAFSAPQSCRHKQLAAPIPAVQSHGPSFCPQVSLHRAMWELILPDKLFWGAKKWVSTHENSSFR